MPLCRLKRILIHEVIENEYKYKNKAPKQWFDTLRLGSEVQLCN